MRTHTTLGLLATSILGASAACSSAPSPGEPASEVTAQTASAVTAPATSGPDKNDDKTKSPIKHVLVIIGENRSFDHVFGTYKPTKHGERVDNILSKGIVKEDGSPGPNFSLAIQKSAVDSPPNTFQLSPPEQTPYAVLPPVTAGGPKTPYVTSLTEAMADESLALPADYLAKLTTGINLRDQHMREKYLEVPKFPVTTLTVARGSLSLPTDGHKTEGDVQGTLSLHGQTRPITVHYDITSQGGALVSHGKFRIDMNAFGITVPTYLGVTVKPNVDVTASFRLSGS